MEKIFVHAQTNKQTNKMHTFAQSHTILSNLETFKHLKTLLWFHIIMIDVF